MTWPDRSDLCRHNDLKLRIPFRNCFYTNTQIYSKWSVEKHKCVINFKECFLNDYIIQRLHGKTMSDFFIGITYYQKKSQTFPAKSWLFCNTFFVKPFYFTLNYFSCPGFFKTNVLCPTFS